MRRSLTTLTTLPMAALLAACPADEGTTRGPSDREGGFTVPFPDANELIAGIEARIVLPEGAGPMESYSRTYSRESWNDEGYEEGYVFGVLESVSDRPGTASWLEGPVSAPMDGGCGVVTLRYDLSSATFDYIRCNGEA